MSERTTKHIIVTGASGLVGHGILNLLKGSKKYHVTGIYQTHKPFIEADNITLIRGDLTKEDIWRMIGPLPADVLIHCAAVIPLSFTEQKQDEVKTVNLLMDGHAIAYVREKNNKLIYISSTSIYGFKINGLRDENSSPSPIGEYLSGKVETENKIVNMKDLLKYFIVRLSAPYGPHQRNHTVMNIFIKNALEKKPLQYYGSGSRMQDFIYVKDIAMACLHAVESQKYGVYNIASGCPISMKTLAYMIKNLTGSESEIRPANIPDPQEGYRALFDIKKANIFLNWFPKYTLERGVREYINYLKGERV